MKQAVIDRRLAAIHQEDNLNSMANILNALQSKSSNLNIKSEIQ